jgi:hypothetical protein
MPIADLMEACNFVILIFRNRDRFRYFAFAKVAMAHPARDLFSENVSLFN